MCIAPERPTSNLIAYDKKLHYPSIVLLLEQAEHKTTTVMVVASL